MTQTSQNRMLQAGRNCWRITNAGRVAFLIDGAEYFAAFRAAVERAARSVVIVGWDFDKRIELLRDDSRHKLPVELGAFLNAVVLDRSELHMHVLLWDFAMVYALERKIIPLYMMRWGGCSRLHLHMDDKHPVGGSHHQKIVVVDDTVAFAGGIDLTNRRWDTPEHKPRDSRRRDPDGDLYGPFHDAQVMVGGATAAALGDLARERWQRATGRLIEVSESSAGDAWPPELQADLSDVRVAIARTEPAFEGREAVREVERLHLDAIAEARRTLYIENQYLTSAAIGEALAQRLREDDGPEIVLVLPLESSGWLEHATMDVLRARLLARLRDADRSGRLRVYYPARPGAGSGSIYVHAKIIVVDDDLVAVGSANLSNRSMSLDTECVLAIESGGDDVTARVIAGLRNRLIAEHLGETASTVERCMVERGSLIAAIEKLRRGERTLRDLDGRVPQSLDEMIPDAALVDPEKPLAPEQLIEEFVPEDEHEPTRRRLGYRVAALAVLLALAAAWRWTPLGDWLDVETATDWFTALRDSPLGPLAMIAAFILGGLVAFPVTVMIVIAALVFGPAFGFMSALVGTIVSAALSYGIGRYLGRDTVRRLAGKRINRLSRKLARRGIVTVAAVRMLPIAPFTVVNMVAGASHIRIRDFLIGTLLGMVPGMLALTVFADSMYAALRDPKPGNIAVLIGIAAMILVGIFFFRRWLRGSGGMREPNTNT